MRYSTHARTLDELRAEFLSDIHRRLAGLDLEAKHERQATKAAAIARGKLELESLLSFWQEVELRGAQRRTRASAAQAQGPNIND